jgi:hypothetical protein
VTGERWVGCTTDCYFYYLNLKTPKKFRCIALASVAQVRAFGAQAIREAKRRPPQGPVAGGWHFSYMGGVDRIIEKLGAFAHAEYDTPAMKDRAFLEERIRTRHDLFGQIPRKFVRVGLEGLPDAVRLHPEKYAHLLLAEGA